jgi:glucose/arabinose dehydrogenase
MVVKVVVKQPFSMRQALLPLLLMILIMASLACANATAQSPQIEPQPIGLDPVAQGFTAPVQVVSAPDVSGRLFVLDQAGQIWVIASNGTLLQEPFLDIADRLVELSPGFDERGLLGLAFHPDYAQNGRFFVYYSAPLREGAPQDFDHTSRISEFSVSSQNPDRADLDSERIILEVDQPQSNHNGGTLFFGPEDGFLYISLGDGGAANDAGLGHVEDWYEFSEGGNGQDVTQNLLGSILRIDVDTGDPYGIPQDNPFAGREGLDEIYAYGLRNPYRMSFDRAGEYGLLAVDAGQELWEEVNIIVKGGNYGWNVKEGTHCFDTRLVLLRSALLRLAKLRLAALEQCPGTVGSNHPDEGALLIDPVVEFANSKQADGLGLTITDGFMYRGLALSGLQGRLVFSTWSTTFAEPRGRLFYAIPADTGLWPIGELIPAQPIEGTVGHFILGMGQNDEGELYIATSDESGPVGQTGRVYKLIPR